MIKFLRKLFEILRESIMAQTQVRLGKVEFSDPRLEEGFVFNQDTGRAVWTTSANMPGRFTYWNKQTPETIINTTPELSSNFGDSDQPHAQPLTVTPGDTYCGYPETTTDGGVTWERLQADTEFMVLELPVGSTDDRAPFWTGQGFAEVWASSPTTADLAGSAKAYFNTPSFNNGNAPRENFIGNYNTDNPQPRAIVTDELGEPAIKVESVPGDRNQLLVRGVQLIGTQYNEVVYSMLIFNPCGVGELLEGPAGGIYQGRGSYWGSDDSLVVAGGSRNFPNAWNVRAPFDGTTSSLRRGKDWLYIYPAREASDTSSGLVVSPPSSTPQKVCGVWQRIETRVRQDMPANSGNALVEHYVDGQKHNEWTGTLRRFEDVYPKGFGFLVQLRDDKPQIIYYRDFRIYAR